MHHIVNKQAFYALSKKLLLGNRLQQWTWEQFSERCAVAPETLPAIVGVRHVRAAFTNKGNSGLFPRHKALAYGAATPDKHNLLFDEGAVHGHLTIQGEVMATERGLYVRYSHLQCHQRTLWHISQNGIAGLAKHQLPHNLETLTPKQRAEGGDGIVLHAQGLRASALLQKYLDLEGWECVNEILGCQIVECSTWGCPVVNFVFPIVEFAAFRKPIGVLGWNCLIWEVRTQY